jgi:CBS domain-containing protein
VIERQVSDFMTEPPRTLPPDATVARAARLLRQAGIGSVVVTADGTADSELVGVLTESDVVSIVADGQPGELPVRAPMSPDPVTVGPEEPVDRVGELVCEHGVRHIPVVEGRVVGIITTKDVACLLPNYRLEAGEADSD